jgi:hypothetical protein
MKGLRRMKKNFNQDSWSPGWDLKQASPESKSGALLLYQSCSVKKLSVCNWLHEEKPVIRESVLLRMS